MPNKWIQHVQAYAAANNISYRESLSKATATWKKSAPEKKVRKKKAKVEAPAEAPPSPVSILKSGKKSPVLKDGKLNVKKRKLKQKKQVIST